MIQNKKYIPIFTVIIVLVIGILIIVLHITHRNDSAPINILLIAIDALRPDHLGCYGYERDTSPNIDTLASQGMLFSQAISAGGRTIESVPSILTGTYSLTHQIQQWDDLRNPSLRTLAWELAIKGYQSVLWSNHGAIKRLDIKDGFQKVYVLDLYNRNNKPILNNYVLTSKIINRIRNQYRNRPFFFYIHYEGCHAPYLPPAPYKYMYLHDKFRKEPDPVIISNISDGEEKYNGIGKIPFVVAENNITDKNYYISQYDGQISHTDAQIGRLMDGLKEIGLYENTLIILTADHGEILGEHDIYFNHQAVYEENIKVPLIIKLPELFPRGKIISTQVSLIDIAPTILEAAGLKKPSYMQGASLLAFVKPFKAYSKKYVFSSFINHKWNDCKIALRTKDWKLIYSNFCRSKISSELYNLRDDSKEQYDLVAKRPDKFRQLKQELDNFIKRATPSTPQRKDSPLTEEAKERLRSLGYAQ